MKYRMSQEYKCNVSRKWKGMEYLSYIIKCFISPYLVNLNYFSKCICFENLQKWRNKLILIHLKFLCLTHLTNLKVQTSLLIKEII